MPKFLEDALAAEAAKKGLIGKAANHYIFGAMNNQGVVRGNKITPKGEALQAKHNRDVAAGTASSQRNSEIGKTKHWSGR